MEKIQADFPRTRMKRQIQRRRGEFLAYLEKEHSNCVRSQGELVSVATSIGGWSEMFHRGWLGIATEI